MEVNITRVTATGPQLVFSAIYDGEGSSKLSWIANLLFVIVDTANTPVTSWSELSANFPGDIVEFHASTVNSTTELHFTRAGGRFRVRDINCLRDGVQAGVAISDWQNREVGKIGESAKSAYRQNREIGKIGESGNQQIGESAKSGNRKKSEN